MNNYEKLKQSIKDCINCSFNWKHSLPLYFDCKSANNINILIITEQPKERIINNKYAEVTEQNIINDVTNPLLINSNSTRSALVRILGEKFVQSIKNSDGIFYWTHHTKCPSYKREIKPECMEKWFSEELKVFTKLKLIISFGTEAYKSISKIFNLNDDFYACFWKEIEHFLKGNVSLPNVNNIEYIALPHPSKANPLSNLLDYIKPYIDKKL